MLTWRTQRRLAAVAATLVSSMLLAACSSAGPASQVDAGGGGGGGGAVLVSGAGGVPGLEAGPDDALVARVRGSDAAQSLTASIELLADAGISVYADPSTTTALQPVKGEASPVRLTRSQVQAMTYEVRDGTGQGMSGAEIDSSSPMPKGAPPLTFVLAAWIAHADTRAAGLARRLMGPHTWTEAPRLAYPQLVLTLFASDMIMDAATQTKGAPPMVKVPAPPPASAGSASSSSTTTASSTAAATVPGLRLLSSSPRTAAAGAACGAVSNFVDNTLDSIANKLQIDPAKLTGTGVVATAGRVLGSIWNFAVNLARSALGAVIDALTAPVIGSIRATVGTLSVIVEVVSLVTNPAHTLTNQGGESFAVDPAPDNKGTVTLTLDPALPWDYPPFVSGCAAASGVQLPNLSGDGGRIDWIVADPVGLITVQKPDRSATGYSGTLARGDGDRRLKATLEFISGRESSNDRASGDEVSGTVTVTAQWGNGPADQLLAFTESLLNHSFSGVVGQAVNPIIHAALSTVLSKLRALTKLNSADIAISVMHSKHVVCTS